MPFSPSIPTASRAASRTCVRSLLANDTMTRAASMSLVRP
jgi:hypothetical protein